jgi:hypothetical protein
MPFNARWNIVILDDNLHPSTVESWIAAAGVPICFNFTFDNTFKYAFNIKNLYNSLIPASDVPWTVLISSRKDPRFQWMIGGISFFGNKNCSIEYDPTYPGDTPADLGARIWHELLHITIGGTQPDNLKTTEFEGFTEYLRATGSPYAASFAANPSQYDAQSAQHTALLIEFYTYLMGKYVECDCYGSGCAPDPGLVPEPTTPVYDPTQQPVDQPVEEPVIEPTDNTTTAPTYTWFYIAGAAVLAYLLL